MKRPTIDVIQEAVWNRCAHPVQFGDGDTTCPRCNVLIDDLVHLTIPHDVYGRPVRFREKASARNILVRMVLGAAWWFGTLWAYIEMVEALVDHWGWDDPSGFVFGGIAYAIVTLCLVVYGIEAREEAHMWEAREW